MSKRAKALAGAFGVFVAALLVIYVINVRETGQMSLVPTAQTQS